MTHSQAKEVLVSITTYHGPQQGSGWKAMLREVEQLGLKRVALFLTGLEPHERRECYAAAQELRRTQNLRIPFVHARADMQPEEYYWLMEEMGTEVFNLHAGSQQFPHAELNASLRQHICIENSGLFRRADFDGFAGICLDLSHLEDSRRFNSWTYHEAIKLLGELPLLANHVSAIPIKPRVLAEDGEMHYDDHRLEALEEVDYVSRYPSNFLSRFIALELFNPISLQLEAAKRLSAIVHGSQGVVAKAA